VQTASQKRFLIFEFLESASGDQDRHLHRASAGRLLHRALLGQAQEATIPLVASPEAPSLNSPHGSCLRQHLDLC